MPMFDGNEYPSRFWYCEQCNKFGKKGADFCTKCGKHLTCVELNATCNQPLGSLACQCPEFIDVADTFCPKCGHKHPEEVKQRILAAKKIHDDLRKQEHEGVRE